MQEFSVDFEMSKLHLKKKQLLRYGKAPMLQEPQLFPSSNKKTYLYDPGNHSSNSEYDDSLKSVSESLGYSSSNHTRRTRSEKSLDDFMSIHDAREMLPSRRLRRMCTSAASRARSEGLEHQTQIGRHKPTHSHTPSAFFEQHVRRTRGYRSGEASAFLDRRSGSSRKKDNRRGDCSSSSLCSITRSGSKIRHHRRKNSLLSYNHESLSQRYQNVPLLEDNSDGACSSTHRTDDDLSSSMQELELEAFSQLCPTKQSALEDRELILTGRSGRENLESRSLCEKYRPRSFDQILGQPFIVESLKNAILKGTSPAYLFQGPSGTGKTTVAMVFAAALNCRSTKDKRPCGLCDTCTDTLCNRNGPIIELGMNTKKGMNRLRYILKHAPAATSIRQFVVVVDGCHILSSEVWLELCRVVEDPPPHVAFIFTVTHRDDLPHSIMSRCKKYRFLKISEADIVSRLRILCAKENIDIEEEALEVIARCSCGSLLEAEMMLDQSTLLGKRITPTTVKDLVGFVSDETALDLLEAALSSDTIETVRKSRELMDFGIDPVALMSQLAGFLTDIIAGTHKLASQQGRDAPYGKNILTEVKLDRLLQALQILSDAEKQLSLSSEPSTWFIAALIKLSSHSLEPNTSSSCSRNSNEKLHDASNKLKHASENSFIASSISKVKSGFYGTQASHLMGSITKMKTDISVSSLESHGTLEEDHHSNEYANRKVLEYASSEKLDMIWRDCIDKCYVDELQQLLAFHLKLVEIKESKSALIACLAATDSKAKHQAERFLSSITNLITTTLKQNVEVMIDIMPRKSSRDNEATNFTNRMGRLNLNMNQLEHSQVDEERSQDLTLLIQTSARNNDSHNKTFFHEQRLDNAWKEEAKKGETEFRTHSLWHSDSRTAGQNGLARIIAGSTNQCAFDTDTNKLNPQSSQHVYNSEHNRKRHHPTLSPSLLHIDNLMADLANKKQGHEDAAEHDGFCCWKTSKTNNREMREERGAIPNMAGILPCFGKGWEWKNKDGRYRK